jgi:response regulator RpfG family c-di-GMP phosphodiesterase
MQRNAKESTMTRQATVLAVDDESSNLQLLRQILQDQYRLLFAKDGARAIELAVNEKPDLVLLDVMMPDMTGYDVPGAESQCRHHRHPRDLRDRAERFDR